MRSSAALLVVLLVVSSVAGVGTSLAADDRERAPRALSEVPAATGPVAAMDTTSVNGTESNVTVHDGTEMYVSIRENGNARWNVTTRFVLRDDNETEAFRRLAENYRNGNADVGFTRNTFERVVERVDADSNRSMQLRDASRSARLRDNGSVGLLSLSFTWRNFTHVEGDRVVLGDAFWIESETWLPSLTDDQTLTIEGPPDHYVSSSNVPHSGTQITYEGPRAFDQGDFSVTYSPKSTKSPTSSNFPDLSDSPGLLVALFLFGSGIIGVYAWSQRDDAEPGPVTESDESRRSTATTTVTDDAGTDAIGDADDADEDDGQDVELLSDEERVLRLLRDNDGRMKQGQIVKETNWSNAKVSQLLSKMSENDDVDKLRIGRENLITLPDEDIADVD